MFCRLCTLNINHNWQYLYDENGLPTEIYRITYKYFPKELSDKVKNYVYDENDYRCSKVICISCWAQMHQFNSFQESIEVLQLEQCKEKVSQKAIAEMTMPTPTVTMKINYDEVETIEIKTDDEHEEKAQKEQQANNHSNNSMHSKIVLLDTSNNAANENHINTNALIRQHFQGKIPCDKCAQHFQQVEDLALHLWDTHELPFYMKCCFYYFSTIEQIVKHIRGHQSGLHRCAKCQVFFDTEAQLDEHVRTMHNLKCKFCEKEFFAAQDLHHHLETHNDVNENKCSICSKFFLNKLGLHLHIKAMHSDEQQKNPKIFCKNCGEEFPKKYQLLKHRCIEMEYICPDCERRFYDKKLYSRHLRTHRRQKEKKRWHENCLKFTTEDLAKIYCNDKDDNETADAAKTETATTTK